MAKEKSLGKMWENSGQWGKYFTIWVFGQGDEVTKYNAYPSKFKEGEYYLKPAKEKGPANAVPQEKVLPPIKDEEDIPF